MHCGTHCPFCRNNRALGKLWQRLQLCALKHCKQPWGQASHTPLCRMAKKPTGHFDTHVCCVVRNRPRGGEAASKHHCSENVTTLNCRSKIKVTKIPFPHVWHWFFSGPEQDSQDGWQSSHSPSSRGETALGLLKNLSDHTTYWFSAKHAAKEKWA